MKTFLRWILIFLFFAGLLLSGYSAYEHIVVEEFSSGNSSLCNISATLNCRAAIQSSFSTIWGIPLGVFGVVFYLLCLVPFSFLRGTPPVLLVRTLSFLSFASLLSSFFLLYVSVTQLSALCPVCLGLYLVSFLIVLAWCWSAGGVGAYLKNVFGAPGSLLSRSSDDPYFSRERLFFVWGIVVLFSGLAYLTLQNQIERGKKTALVSPGTKVLTAYLSNPVQKLPAPVFSGPGTDFGVGPEDAPVRLVEFFDYECPFCRQFSWALKDLQEKYAEDLRIEYRSYPLDHRCNPSIEGQFHQVACLSAEFVRCAGEQQRFLEAHEFIMGLEAFEETESRSELTSAIDAGVDRLGLDRQAMNECLESDRQLEKIKSDIALADKLGVQGTPSIWINDRQVSNLNPSALSTVVEHVRGRK